MHSSKASIVNARLQEVSLRYCILHGWQGLPEHLPSDLDIVVAPEDLSRLEKALLEMEGAQLVQLLQHESTCYYFVLGMLGENEVQFLPVDAATDYRRNGRVWFSAEELLKGRKQWKDFWVAAPEVEFKYLLVKKILKADVPEHAAERLRELASTLDQQAEAVAKGLLGKEWGPKVVRWIHSGEWEVFQEHLGMLKRVLKRQRLRQDPLNSVRYWLPELKRIWRRWRHPTGLWVVVLGPDGAGKSTLIAGLESEMAGAFRRTARFHLMPGLLRRQGEGGPVTDPHGKPPRSWFTSLLKLAYYWLDYTLGYWLKIRPLLVRSTLVLFDRYYDDLLIDPRRYRYGGPMWAVLPLRRLIPRPDLFLVLDVPKEQLLERKVEVAPQELERQVRAYRQFAANTPNAVLLDGSLPPEEVARQAREVVLELLHERYRSRRSIWFPRNREWETLKWVAQALNDRETPGEQRKSLLHLALPDGRGYLLPQNSRQAAVKGLSLYAPQKRRARLTKGILHLGLKAGVAQRFLPKVHLGLQDLQGFLEEVFDRRDLSLAVSLGTPGPHRKPVVQVLTEKGEVLGYVKVGWNEATKDLVRNETRVLQALQKQDLPLDTPQVLYAGDYGNYVLCVQGPPPPGARSAPRELTTEYVEVLCALTRRALCWQLLEESQFWKRITERVQRIENTYWQRVLHRALEGVCKDWRNREVPFHFAHGDFAPWNALRADGRIYLFDWEYAQEETPAGYDSFHFLVQTSWLVDGLQPHEIVKTVLNQAIERHMGKYWKCAGVQTSDIPILFRLYLLYRLSLRCTTEWFALDELEVAKTLYLLTSAEEVLL